MCNRIRILFFLFFLCGGVIAKPAPGGFEKIEQDLQRFEKDRNAKKYRDKYEALLERLGKFVRRDQNDERVGDAMRWIVRLRKEIAQITRKQTDKKLLAKAEGELRLYEKKKSQKKKTAEVVKKVETISSTETDKEPILISSLAVENFAQGLRLTLHASGSLKVTRGEIPKSADQPKRLYFDLTPAHLDEKMEPTKDLNHVGLSKLRLGQFKEDVVRLVIEANEGAPKLVTVRDEGEHLDIAFGTEPIEQPPTSAKEEREVEEQIEKPILKPAQNLLRLKRIVIDPGHGGNDPGAIGKKGLREKDVTLAVSKRIRDMIRKEMPDVEVIMTRDSDKTLALSQRTKIANDAQADLFISVHVNSSPNKETQGIETYYLNVTSDRYALRLSARENAMSESEVSNLEFILADLAMKSSVQDSIRLGEIVQGSTLTRLQNDWSNVRDLGLKHALFYVLLGAKMPAILVETSFISNREDEKRLRTPGYQHALAEGVVKGIRRFMDEKQAMRISK